MRSRTGGSGESPGSRSSRCAVIGLGNPLRGDDGIVPMLFEQLRAADPGPAATLIEYRDANLRLVHALEEFNHVLLVDAVDFGGKPGEHAVFRPSEAVSVGDHGGSHDANVLELVDLAERLGADPLSVRIFGIQPATMEPGTQLSKHLEEQLPELRAALLDTISEFREVGE